MWLILAAEQPAVHSPGAEPFYVYAVSILAAVIAGLWALKKYNDKQREKWIHQGKQEQDLTDQLEKNAEATKHNTAAIEKMVARIDEFVARVDSRLNGHDKRIEKLEDYANYGTAPYRRNRNNP